MKLYRIIFAVVGWSAFIYSLLLSSHELVDFFSYFTIQSNLLVVIWFTLAVFNNQLVYQPLIRSGLLVYITVTMIVFFSLLFNSSVGLNFVTSYVLHLIMPLAYVVDWLIDRPNKKLKLKTALLWLIYPIIYCVYTLVRGRVVGWYPYYFLSPVRMHSYEGVEFSILGLAAFFVVIIFSVYYLHNRLAESVSSGKL